METPEARGQKFVPSRRYFGPDGKWHNAGRDSGRFALVGKRADGIEVYETPVAIRTLPYKEKAALFRQMMADTYKGRRARFVIDGVEHLAEFDKAGIKKNTHGDTKSHSLGRTAKIDVAASGDIFDLVENAKYDHSTPESHQKQTPVHEETKEWHYFHKTVQIDGGVFDVLVNVRQTADNEFVYGIRLRQNKRIGPANSVKPNEGHGGSSARQGDDSTSSAPGSQAENAPGRNAVASRVTPAEDAAYMDAVKRGDMDAAQRMVREAAAKAVPESTIEPTRLVEPRWIVTPNEIRDKARHQLASATCAV